MTEEPKDPKAAGDKPASETPGEPLKGEVSRTDSPGAGASAAPTPPVAPPAPKPENPAAAVTAATSETSSATGQPAASLTAEAANAAKSPAAPAATAAKPVAPAAAKPATSAAPKPAAAHDTKPAPPAGPTDPAPPAGTEIPAFITALQAAIPDAITQVSFYVGDWTIIVPAAKLIDVTRFLRDTPDAEFDFCSDVTASDWPTRSQRFDVIYCLFSTRHRKRVRVKVRAAESEPVPSVSAVWPAANWLEREVYDLFGVHITGHPKLTRILMPDDWQGHPQRKDYPLEGPGELLMENPLDWLKLKQAREESEIE